MDEAMNMNLSIDVINPIQTEWLKATLGRHGGWICAPTHHVQQDTPVENFLELLKHIQTRIKK